ncbi:coiled coil domain containing 88A [Rhizoctonia solani AG-1 IB]|uniref:Coiled coil domain containing 88A n=1 Tax=Thanatephorus cucumeris (strain AG1-IB / isolate 7/3/14) TaxID=1108050 RepID=A0A0B7FYX8_THACB|nr:coiled coil domain containing 88A [Rhizoctonia solani AG-1 IB]
MLRALATMLPHSMSKNVGLLLTNCDSDTQKLETSSLPSEFSHLQSWTFQDPLPFCLSYRAQEKWRAQRQRAAQKRKLDFIYGAAADTANEIIEWIDQTPVQPATGMLNLSNMHGSKSKADLERIGTKVKLMQANVNKALESLQQQESSIVQSRATVLGLVQSINQDSLGLEFADYIGAALGAFHYHKIHTTSIDGPGKIDEEINRLETCASILASEITEDIAGMLPGLISMKSVLGPLRTKKRLTMLLVGENGCGKTAFMSLLLNLFQGYGPFELEDENGDDAESGLMKQESQTSDATLYTVIPPDGTEIQILYIPGQTDTLGIRQDEQHKAKMNKAIQDTLTSLLPYSIVDNIAFIFTHCDSFTRNLDMAGLPETLRKSKHWTLENPLAYHKKYQRAVKAGYSESILKEGRERLETIYKKTVMTLNDWLRWVDARCPQPTHEINRLYQTIVDIEAQIEAAISLVTRHGEKQRELQTAQRGLEDHRKSKSAIQALCNQTIEYWEREPDDKDNVICIAQGCYSNCQIDCSLPFTFCPGLADIGRYCEAFVYSVDDARRRNTESDDASISRRCKQCSHEAREHRHYKNKHVKRTRALHPTAKNDLAKAETEGQRLEVAKRVVQQELDSTQLELDRVQAKVNSLVDTYNRGSLNKNFAGHINSAIRMTELRLEELKSKSGTEYEQSAVASAIQKLKSKLDVLRQSRGSS